MPEISVLNLQRQWHVLSAGARQRIDPRDFYGISCLQKPEFTPDFVTDIAAIDGRGVAQIISRDCDGARSEQTFVTSFS